MTQEQQPLEPHRTAEAHARRRRLGEMFDRAAVTVLEAHDDAIAMAEELRRDPRWQEPPSRQANL